MGRIVCIVTTNTTMYDRFKTTTVQTLCSIECALSQKCRFSKKKQQKKNQNNSSLLLLSAVVAAVGNVVGNNLYAYVCVCLYSIIQNGSFIYQSTSTFSNSLLSLVQRFFVLLPSKLVNHASTFTSHIILGWVLHIVFSSFLTFVSLLAESLENIVRRTSITQRILSVRKFNQVKMISIFFKKWLIF